MHFPRYQVLKMCRVDAYKGLCLVLSESFSLKRINRDSFRLCSQVITLLDAFVRHIVFK